MIPNWPLYAMSTQTTEDPLYPGYIEVLVETMHRGQKWGTRLLVAPEHRSWVADVQERALEKLTETLEREDAKARHPSGRARGLFRGLKK